jgi:hypothetical protein
MVENGRRKGDDALLLALASGQTIHDAARAADISERTATRRIADGPQEAVADVWREVRGGQDNPPE